MKNINRIENYLYNKMSLEERTTFEEDCQTNKELTEEFAFYIQAQQAAQQVKKEAFNQRYKNLTPQEKAPLSMFFRYKWYWLIGIILVLFTIKISFKNTLNPENIEKTPIVEEVYQQELLAELIVKNDSINHLASAYQSGTDNKDIYDEAIILARKEKNQQYQEAINKIKDLDDYKALEIKGFCYLGLKEYQKAIEIYRAYLELKDGEYHLFAKWNLILAHRRLGQSEEEQILLESLSKRELEQLNKNVKK